MKLLFTPKAAENIAAIAEYIRAHSSEAARRVRDDIYDSLQILLLFPHAGRRQLTTGVRKLVTRKFAYLVYYVSDSAAEEIIVLSVKHPAQKREHSDT